MIWINEWLFHKESIAEIANLAFKKEIEEKVCGQKKKREFLIEKFSKSLQYDFYMCIRVVINLKLANTKNFEKLR